MTNTQHPFRVGRSSNTLVFAGFSLFFVITIGQETKAIESIDILDTAFILSYAKNSKLSTQIDIKQK